MERLKKRRDCGIDVSHAVALLGTAAVDRREQ